jgi:NADH-quinone oxidoreductase subunit L
MNFTDLIWLVPLLPLGGALVNGLVGQRLPRRIVAALASTTVGIAFLLALGAMMTDGNLTAPQIRTYFTWIAAGSFQATAGLRLDVLSGLMTLIVTGVGFLIHVYSAGYMADEPGLYRYFAYLNLFVFAMLTLVLADNYLLMFVGWEGVGLCSYLLIGFWFSKREAADAGKKAFVVNRIGDFGFVLALLLMATVFGSLDFDTVAAQAPNVGGAATAICLLMLLGAAGKSAQLPLYVWLPDAMEGPTPVSALIHAATMVTAGVYMVTRSAALFTAAPAAMTVIAVVGSLTALFAATIALVQTDIKRVLAYSTISQLGYMFMACGVGAWAAAIFHLMTHAFFKALLFLGAGSVIHGMGGVQDLGKMGGLRTRMPWTFRTFLIGSLALAGLPPLAGFFSKDAILWSVWSRAGYGPLLWGIGVVTAGLTAFYTLRLVILAFYGEPRYTDEQTHVHESGPVMLLPLLCLGVFSVIAGFAGVPELLGGGDAIVRFLEPVLGNPGVGDEASRASEALVMAVSVAAALAGLGLAIRFYAGEGDLPGKTARSLPGLYRILAGKYYVDQIYDAVIVRPLIGISRVVLWRGVDAEVIDGVVNQTGTTMRILAGGLRLVQSGYLRVYAAWIAVGGALVAAWLLAN